MTANYFCSLRFKVDLFAASIIFLSPGMEGTYFWTQRRFFSQFDFFQLTNRAFERFCRWASKLRFFLLNFGQMRFWEPPRLLETEICRRRAKSLLFPSTYLINIINKWGWFEWLICDWKKHFTKIKWRHLLSFHSNKKISLTNYKTNNNLTVGTEQLYLPSKKVSQQTLTRIRLTSANYIQP